MRVLLIVIDGASPRVVNPAIQTGRLSNLKRVADAGRMHAGAATIFPSITPAATSSIATGCYPAEHGIGGASWYDESRQEVVYYGDDFWVIARRGFGAFLRDFLLHLNGDRLKAPTLFELAERSGVTAACVNYLVYRGNVSHRVNVPWLMALLPGVPLAETVKGPSLLCLGDFVTPRAVRGRKVDGRAGLLHRFGMDDASTAAILCDLVEARALPDFTLAYFADNDYESHAVGPHAALPVVDRVDAALGRVFDAAGGFERFVRDTCVVVTSDHGHCEILEDREESIIPLHEVLSDFRHGDLGRAWRARDEIMVCPNMRAAQIHLRQPGAVLLDRVTRALVADVRVDVVLTRRTGAHGGTDVYVVDSSRGRLEFWRDDEGGAQARDPFGTPWGWHGDTAALHLELDGDRVDSTEYPNAFERIAGALDLANQGDIWVSARPGCEFEVPGGKGHPGGASHGALHALDSLSITLAGGVDVPELPAVLRTVDIAPLCAALLGTPMRYRVGEARRLTPALE